MKHLDAIFFDVDDTLFSTSEFAKLARLSSIHAMVQHGLKMSPEDAFEELQEVIGEFGSNYSQHYHKLLLRVPSQALGKINPSILIAAAVGAYHKAKYEKLTPFEDVVEVLSALSSQYDVCLGIITAGLEIKQADKLVRLGVLPYINPEAIFITDQIGISKPNPKLFLRVCQQMGLKPERCLYVGDNPLHDIDPANQVGWFTVWSRRSGRHVHLQGKSTPDFVIENMWELMELLQANFLLKPSPVE